MRPPCGSTTSGWPPIAGNYRNRWFRIVPEPAETHRFPIGGTALMYKNTFLSQ
jgi:hypothetical protein